MPMIKCKQNSPSKLRDSKRKLKRQRPPQLPWPSSNKFYSNNCNNSRHKSNKRGWLPIRNFSKLKLKEVCKLNNFNKCNKRWRDKGRSKKPRPDNWSNNWPLLREDKNLFKISMVLDTPTLWLWDKLWVSQ